MAKDRRSRDQKRKDKLAKDSKKKAIADVAPYEGSKYHADSWLSTVANTELGVYDAIVASHRTLSNRTVEAAFVELVRGLRDGLSPTPVDDEPKVLYTKETERESIVWNIRHHWSIMFERGDTVATEDLIGILRTLLYSIRAHAANTGPSMGYVHFLYNLMNGTPPVANFLRG